MQNENQLRVLTMYIRDKERNARLSLKRIPIRRHSFFLRAYKLDGRAFRDGIEFDPI